MKRTCKYRLPFTVISIAIVAIPILALARQKSPPETMEVVPATGDNAGQAFQNQPNSVVARAKIRQTIDGTPMLFASVGDVLTVVEQKEDTLLVQSATGQKGWVRRRAVAALADSAPIYDELIQGEPKKAELFVLRATVWAVRGDLEKAIADYSTAIELGRKDAITFVNRGVFFASASKFDEAIADYTTALQVDPKNVPAYVNRAAAHLAKKELPQATADYSAIIELDPQKPGGYIRRGLFYRHIQDWDHAIADFSKALDLEPNNLVAVGHRGFAYYAKSDHANAVQDFDRAIKIKPDDGVAHNNRGFNRQALGDYAGALADYDEAIKLAPKYGLAYQNKAWMLATCPEEAHRNGKLALETARKVCELRENKVASDIKALAAAHAELGEFEAAVENQKKVVEMTKDEAQQSTETEILRLYEARQAFRTLPPKKPEPSKPQP